MTSQAFAGVGTKFQRWNGASWDDIAEVNSIEGPGMTKDVLEVTSLETDAGYNEFITGFAEGGQVTLDMNFTRETYELMKEDFESDEVKSYRIQLDDFESEPSTFTFDGLVIELPITMAADDKVTADVVIQVTSEVVLDIGSTVPAEESEEPIPEESSEEPEAQDLYETLLGIFNDDGLTEVFYLFNEGVTVEDTDKVIVMDNLLNSGGTDAVETQSDGTRPSLTATGVLFDGVDDVLQSGLFSAIAQPFTIYAVFKNISYVSNDKVVSFATTEISIRQYATYNRVSLYTGTDNMYSVYDSFYMGQHNIFIGCMNGASSWLHLNKDPEITGNAGTRTINQITLGASPTLVSNANVEIAALIVRRGNDSAKEASIWTALNDALVHYPISAVCSDGDTNRIQVVFNESLDTATDDIGPGDFAIVTGHTVVGLDIDSADDKILNLNLNNNVANGESLVIIFAQSSAGGLLTATGKPVPNFKIGVTNNVS